MESVIRPLIWGPNEDFVLRRFSSYPHMCGIFQGLSPPTEAGITCVIHITSIDRMERYASVNLATKESRKAEDEQRCDPIQSIG